MQLTPEQVQNLRDDGCVLLDALDATVYGIQLDLVNVLAQRGHVLPWCFTDQEAVDDWHARRKAFVDEHNREDNAASAGQRVPVLWTEPQPLPLAGFYPTTDSGRVAVLRVHPDDRTQYAWTLGLQAADACVERTANRRAYNRDMAHHD